MRTKIFTTFLALVAMATSALAQFGGGDGTAGNPYLISTVDHMTKLANDVNAGNSYTWTYFRLDADLDYAGKTYHVIGGVSGGNQYSFRGWFDGDGHTIRNVTIDTGVGSWAETNRYIGIFGLIGPTATIQNLTLGGTSLLKARSDVGGIVGAAEGTEVSPAFIENCHVESGVTFEPSEPFNNEFIGGIVGRAYNVGLTDCTSAATVIANEEHGHYVGGIVGFLLDATLKNCVNSGAVSGYYAVGGIAGGVVCSNKTLRVMYSTNTGSVTGLGYVGGVVGNLDDDSEFVGNSVGGNCSIGAIGVSESSAGTDAGVDVTHLYTAGINWAQINTGSIDTPPFKTIGGTNYYAAGTPITLSGLYTFGTPAGGGMMWNYRAFIDYSNYVDVLPQEDGTWRFFMPAANVSIIPHGAKNITIKEGNYQHTTNVTLTPTSATYTGSGQKPTVAVKRYVTKLTEGTDFITDIPAKGFTAVGKHPFRIWGIGDYGGLRIDTFTIEKAPLTMLALSETMAFHDGAAHKLTLTVKSGSKTLVKGSDYETDLPNEGFTDLGEYTIKAWGIGNYTDTLSATFTIKHPWVGMGTQENPFLIQNTDDMDRLASFVNAGKDYRGVFFRQAANLDFTGKVYTPVGNDAETNQFQGTYDGYYYAITGVDTKGHDCTGLFGNVGTNGTVKSVKLVGTNKFEGKSGGECGCIVAYNQGRVESCIVAEDADVTVTTKGAIAGGIVGHNDGEVLSCINHSAYLNANTVGGIVGFNRGYVEGFNYATLNGLETAGGICGVNYSGTVTGWHYGTLQPGATYCGGIVGENMGHVEHCVSTDLMTSLKDGDFKGAIIGKNQGTAAYNYYIGACKFGGISGTDVICQAMRGWPISHDEAIGFSPMPDAAGNIVGTYYDDGTNNYFYVGEGEKLRFMLFGGINYTANGTALASAGHDDDYDVDFFELTMPAQLVHIAPVGLTLTLYDNWINADNEGYIAEADGELRDVTISGRTFCKNGEWSTLCLPFAINDFTGTPLEGATVMELDSDGKNGLDFATGTLHLTFKNATCIAAGQPYIIKWTDGADVTEPIFAGVTIDATQPAAVTAQSAGFGGVTFKGSYAFTWVAAGDKTQLFLTPDSRLNYAEEDRRQLPFRAWFVVDESTAQGIHAFALNFGGEITAIPSIKHSPLNTEYGYTIDGRRVNFQNSKMINSIKKGVYIINGKKVIF